ncbi:hypothetical protein HNQ02_003888 [Flavobacterium sp. 7E]|uniref:abortive infection system antitoxin AbiGi family protein n=1 Tax=Flavobacterium sp. 7E TaxID=2735898 RepID=UPI00156DE667|nr:abortive infection system antitoxin AbiGi family protein [Flavobacterium sp. 7E]NRS90933.1 hypothetical protein [Flavobacterium sp. 7E]
MMNENLIIHFTDEFEKLYSILKCTSFRLSHCKEEFTVKRKNKNRTVSKAVHPMVCFSEKNEDNLRNEIITYGKYGISFQKTWAIKKGIKPVDYLEKESSSAKKLGKRLILRRKLAKNKITSQIRLKIITEKCFVKNAFGYNSYLKKNFEFKSENEWRYVPTKKQIGGGYISESRNKFLANINFYKKQVSKYPLTFDINDVITLFVNDENEIKRLKSDFGILSEKIKIRKWNVK